MRGLRSARLSWIVLGVRDEGFLATHIQLV